MSECEHTQGFDDECLCFECYLLADDCVSKLQAQLKQLWEAGQAVEFQRKKPPAHWGMKGSSMIANWYLDELKALAATTGDKGER